ncbi:RNA 3'-terminal phosphate cyclase [Sphingomonas panni]
MIEIDGAEGEGGGQAVRNACALSLVTGESVRITNVRARRSKPGLMRQHVTAIEAACAIGGATCEGLVVGSSDLTFLPGRVTAGEYRFSVGTAGSTGLVLQTVLMPLLLADGPSRLVLEGGTHNMLAPPFEFIERSFLPIVRRMGGQVEVRLIRHGFYPRGGGRIDADITPGPLQPIECLTRGEALGVSACALFAGLPMSIAEREIAMVRKAFGWSERECFMRELPVDQGPGNILLLEAQFEQVTEIVSGFAQLGVTAEQNREDGGRADARLSGVRCLCWAVSRRPIAAADGPGGRRRVHHRQAERACPHVGDGDRAFHRAAYPVRAAGGRGACCDDRLSGPRSAMYGSRCPPQHEG